MSELWEAGRYGEAAALYDAGAPATTPLDAAILRARAYLKSDDAPSAINVLEHREPGRGVSAARRSMVLAQSYAHIAKYQAADELFDNAQRIAREVNDDTLLADISYNRAQRYLFERHTEAARELLPKVRAARAEFAQLRALHLESFILEMEGRHHDAARVLLALLARIDPHRGLYTEIRAWATNTLASLARELYVPQAFAEVERQLGGVDWPPDFDDRRFQTLRALGWACALRGDYFNAFRFLRLSSKKATSDAWRAIAAAERAELARCKGEPLWSRQELAEAEEYASAVDWNAVRDDSRIGLLLLADLFVSIDPAKAAYYRSRFAEYENIKAPNFFYRSDPRLEALANYSSGIVDLALDRRKIGLESLRAALSTFEIHLYDWRAGRCALRLYKETRDALYLRIASERLRNYMHCWLGDEVRAMTGSGAMLTPTQQRIYEMLLDGLSTADIVARVARSPSTVRNHIKAILKASHVNSRVALVALSGKARR